MDKIEWKQKVFKLYFDYVDTLEQLEVYTTVIRQAIDETEDTDYVREKILEVIELKKKAETLKMEVEKVKSRGYIL
jgi:hypothetical protein